MGSTKKNKKPLVKAGPKGGVVTIELDTQTAKTLLAALLLGLGGGNGKKKK